MKNDALQSLFRDLAMAERRHASWHGVPPCGIFAKAAIFFGSDEWHPSGYWKEEVETGELLY